MLVRMSHRGGCGCDPRSGDGAGMLVAMPDSFMRAHAPFPLPPKGDYAVSMCFLPQDEANAARSRASGAARPHPVPQARTQLTSPE